MTVKEQVEGRGRRKAIQLATDLEDALVFLEKWAGQEVFVTEFAGVDGVQTETVRVRGMFCPHIGEEHGEPSLVLYANPTHNVPTTVHYVLESDFRSLLYEGYPDNRLVVDGEYGRLEAELVPGGADSRILYGLIVSERSGSAVAYRTIPVEGNPRLVRPDDGEEW